MCCVTSLAQAQIQPQAEYAPSLSVPTAAANLLEQAKTLFLDGAYAPARSAIDRLMQSGATVTQITEAQELLARIQFATSPSTSMPALEKYLSDYPDAGQRNLIRALLAQAYYSAGDYESTLEVAREVDLSTLGETDAAHLLVTEAMVLIETGRNEEARALLRGVLEQDGPCMGDAFFYTAYLDYVEGHYAEAAQGFNTMLPDARFREQALYLQAQSYLDASDFDKALDNAERYLAEYPQGAYALGMNRIKGEALYGKKDFANSALVLEEYLASCDTPTREALYQLGMAHYNSGEFLRAPEVLAMVADSADVLAQNAALHAGLSFLKIDDKNRARLLFEEAAGMEADKFLREQAMYNYLVCLHETGYSAFGETLTAYERFLNDFPNSPYADNASTYLVEMYMSTKNYEAALTSIEKIKQPTETVLKAKQQLLCKAGQEAYTNNSVDEAIEKLNQAIAMGTYDRQAKADAYFWRAESFYRKGAYGKAVSDYASYLNNTPSDTNYTYPLALYGLGYSQFQQQNYNEAYRNFDRLASLSKTPGRIDNTTLADAYMRMGDCYFQARQYVNAEKTYNKAVEVDVSTADYAIYQKAFSQGLTGRYQDKINTLTSLVENYPSSDYADDALYEKGRAYVQLENNAKAMQAFVQLVEQYPTSRYASIAGNEMALIYYQNGQVDEAVKAYKNVITNFPGSEQATVAMRDLKSLYVEQNRVDDYVSFAEQTKGTVKVDVSERDSLTYIAAEQIYMRGENTSAAKAFENYLSQYPNGAYTLDAHYYLGCIRSSQGKEDEALTHLSMVAKQKMSRHGEEAMRMVADMAYDKKDYEQALSYYKDLKTMTDQPENRLHAQTFLVRSAYNLERYDDVVGEVDALLGDSKLAPATAIEMRYYRAKSLLAEKKGSKAEDDLASLAKDTRTIYGAEGKYLLAQYYYDNNQLAKAEKEVFDYINVSTPHSYWLARSFILLADVYMKGGRDLEAKQYLLSLQQNYSADDDIQSRINERLAKLK